MLSITFSEIEMANDRYPVRVRALLTYCHQCSWTTTPDVGTEFGTRGDSCDGTDGWGFPDIHRTTALRKGLSQGKQPSQKSMAHPHAQITSDTLRQPIRSASSRSDIPPHARPCQRTASASSTAARVLCMSMATVIGPTPPGTGVIQDARALAASKPMSPISFPLG